MVPQNLTLLGKTFLNIIKKGCEYWDGDSDILQISIPFVIQCITDMNVYNESF